MELSMSIKNLTNFISSLALCRASMLHSRCTFYSSFFFVLQLAGVIGRHQRQQVTQGNHIWYQGIGTEIEYKRTWNRRIDLVDCDESRWMEQKRGIGHRSGNETSQAIHEIVWSILNNWPCWIIVDLQSARVLLWKHEFHEGFPENRPSFLQRLVSSSFNVEAQWRLVEFQTRVLLAAKRLAIIPAFA